MLERMLQIRVEASIRSTITSSGNRSDTSKITSSNQLLCTIVSFGIVVTASHNDVEDNGLKIIDPNGGMLEECWEKPMEHIANACDIEAIEREIKYIQLEKTVQNGHNENGEEKNAEKRLVLLVARDTRPSGTQLVQQIIETAKIWGKQKNIHVIDMGIMTTPQLHWIVRERNYGKNKEATVQDYNRQLVESFRKAFEMQALEVKRGKAEKLILDAANGVGAQQFKSIAHAIETVISITIRNQGEGVLNDNVGADFVQKTQSLPMNFSANEDQGQKLASFDGDADRIVYFYINDDGKFVLLDGDKILVLFATYLISLIKAADLQVELSLGVVQTAYANGSSTKYIANLLQLPVVCTSTGVKHLHRCAASFDIGVYFEANGHGTVLFQDHAVSIIEQRSRSGNVAATVLANCCKLMNQGTGDAIADLLFTELSLSHLNWTVQHWSTVYLDLPSIQLTVKVRDRTELITTNADTLVLQPIGLQDEIDRIVHSVEDNNCRTFVRPSGTEDIVRVYAEASTAAHAQSLGDAVANAVLRFCV